MFWIAHIKTTPEVHNVLHIKKRHFYKFRKVPVREN